MTDLLTPQKKIPRVLIFSPEKYVGPPRHVYCKYPPGLMSLHFILTSYDLLLEKPKIIIPSYVVRIARNHILKCSSEGSSPIKMSLFKNSTSLADGIGMAMTKIDKEGIYRCLATNVAGSDSKEFMVTFVGRSVLFCFFFLIVALQIYRSFLLPSITNIIIHQIFFRARDWLRLVTWSNMPQLKLESIQEYAPGDIPQFRILRFMFARLVFVPRKLFTSIEMNI